MMKHNKKHRLRDIVEEYLEYTEKPTIDKIVNIIRPHYKFNKSAIRGDKKTE